MQDKQVGELWSWVADDSVDVGLIPHAKVRALIRKLVEERALANKWAWMSYPSEPTDSHWRWSAKNWQQEARVELGIPEEGWK